MDILIRRVTFEEGHDYKLVVIKSDGKVWSLDGESSVFFESVVFDGKKYFRLVDADQIKRSVTYQCEIASELGQRLSLPGMEELSDLLKEGMCKEVDNADTILEFGKK